MNKTCAQFRDEPMGGSAMDSQRWLLWEHPGPYPAKLDQLEDPAYPHIKNLAQELDASLLLIRKFHYKKLHRLPQSQQIHLFYSDGENLRLLEVDTLTSFLSMDDLRNAPIQTDPIFLICTNGKRDQCCAIYGRALLTELLDETLYEPYLWECSHFGGHRFAPMMLGLPSGYCYGRLNSAVAHEIMQHSLEQRVFPRNLRGRCGLTPAEQIVDIAVRELFPPLALDAVKIIIDSAESMQAILRDESGGTHSYAVILTEQIFPSRPASCGAEWESGSTLVVNSLERIS